MLAEKAPKLQYVRVSEDSRRSAHGGASRGDMMAALNQIEREIADATGRAQAAQMALSNLNTKIRGNRLPTGEYSRLCAEQVAQRTQFTKATEEVRDLKARREALREKSTGITGDQFAHRTLSQLNALNLIHDELREIKEVLLEVLRSRNE